MVAQLLQQSHLLHQQQAGGGGSTRFDAAPQQNTGNDSPSEASTQAKEHATPRSLLSYFERGDQRIRNSGQNGD